MNEWNIQSRGHACQSCNGGFADRQTYYTILFDEKKDFLRIDVCEKCWKEQFSESRDRKGFISCWHGEYEAPPAPVEAIQKENAETLLRKLIEVNDPKHAAASYILAVMLERKRILKVKEQIRIEGKRIFVYEQPRTGDVFTIPDPDLQLNQLDEVQRDVAHLLEHGLEAPEQVAAAPSPEAALDPQAVPVGTAAS
ncbi:MAG TPA: hypothetical protein VNT99_09995 [Methylomirabilota bacterium]|nr:hypothetical protein [Methylomirabilota bacterium]